MNVAQFKRAAQHLFDAHERRERFTPLPPELAPRTGEEGYAIQDAFLALRAVNTSNVGAHAVSVVPLNKGMAVLPSR